VFAIEGKVGHLVLEKEKGERTVTAKHVRERKEENACSKGKREEATSRVI